MFPTATATLGLTITNPVGATGSRATSDGGHGILGMRERASLLGGSLDAAPGRHDFLVRARLPYGRGGGVSRAVRVLLVDDDDLMRAGLRAVLSSDASIEVVGEAATAVPPSSASRALRPDLVLMDVRMPDLDGIAATREVLATSPEVKVVILTTFEQDDYIFGALNAGASGFLLKRTSPEELLAAIHTVAAGDSLLSPSVTRIVIERMTRQPAPESGGPIRSTG